MAGPEGERIVIYKPQDRYAAASKGVLLTSNKITEAQIRAFCGGCDNLQPNNTCYVGDDQARYAERLWCGWAKVDGTPGKMIIEGFVPATGFRRRG